MNYSLRRQKAIDLLSAQGLQALVLCRPENLRYLCGFTGTDGALVVTASETIFLTDSRYTEQAKEEVVAERVQEYKVKTDAIVETLQQAGSTVVGFEATLSYAVVMELQAKAGADLAWRGLKEEVEALRLHKDAEELTTILHAADLNARSFNAVRELIRPGAREREIALAIEFSQKNLGADEKAFDYIVASGCRGALPHGVASDRVLQQGELVTIDFGCRYNGYHSDETVTLAVGDVAPELRRLHDVVLEAHDRAIAAVVPGCALAEIDRIARDYIAAAGYGQYFGHGLGHGVGLEVHEAPVVSPRSKMVVEQGMVFTIEPGIYVPGLGGVRIEDMLLVTATGSQIITKIPKRFCDILVN